MDESNNGETQGLPSNSPTPPSGPTIYPQLGKLGQNIVDLTKQPGGWIEVLAGQVILVAYQAGVMACVLNYPKKFVDALKLTKDKTLTITPELTLDELASPFSKGAQVELTAFCHKPKGLATGSSLVVARDLVMRWKDLYAAYKLLRPDAPAMVFARKEIVELPRESDLAVLITRKNNPATVDKNHLLGKSN